MTALLDEAYLRLIDVTRSSGGTARPKRSCKRGGGAMKTSVDETLLVLTAPGHDLLALDDALTTLETMDRRKSQRNALQRYFLVGLARDFSSRSAVAAAASASSVQWN